MCMQPVKKESKLLATLSVFCRWHMFESAVGRQTLGELFAYYQQSDEWGKPAQGSGLLDYFVSMADRHNVPADTTAAVKSCLLTVFQYADCLQSIKQYAFAASQPDSSPSETALLHRLDQICRYDALHLHKISIYICYHMIYIHLYMKKWAYNTVLGS